MQAILALLLGAGVGLANQVIIMWLVGRLGERQAKGVIFEFTGGLLLRLVLDAAALYAAWRMWGTPLSFILTVSGLLLSTGISAGWHFRMSQGRVARR